MSEISFQVPVKKETVEKELIIKTLDYHNGNRTHTARTLGIGIRTLQRKLRRYGLQGYLLTHNINGIKRHDTIQSPVSETTVCQLDR